MAISGMNVAAVCVSADLDHPGPGPHNPLFRTERAATSHREDECHIGGSRTLRASRSVTLTPASHADQFRRRHSWHATTAVYRTVAAPEAVLALLERKGEGPPEVIVDPRMLAAVEQVRPLHPQRFRQDG